MTLEIHARTSPFTNDPCFLTAGEPGDCVVGEGLCYTKLPKEAGEQREQTTLHSGPGVRTSLVLLKEPIEWNLWTTSHDGCIESVASGDAHMSQPMQRMVNGFQKTQCLCG